jgi:hypothetical protein
VTVIDPSGWLKLCDHFQQKLFQVSDQTSELSFLWQRSNALARRRSNLGTQ